MLNHLKQHFGSHRTGGHGGLDIARNIGPGLLVTVGFIDPGNWASNMAAGSQFGYALLWIVTLSTIMLIVLQHNEHNRGQCDDPQQRVAKLRARGHIGGPVARVDKADGHEQPGADIPRNV